MSRWSSAGSGAGFVWAVPGATSVTAAGSSSGQARRGQGARQEGRVSPAAQGALLVVLWKLKPCRERSVSALLSVCWMLV